MRQGNSCRHLLLYYPRWEVELLLFYIFNCYRVTVPACVCTWAVGERTGNTELGTAAEDLGISRDLLGFGAVGQQVHSTLPRKNRVPTLWVPAFSFLLLPGFKL